MGSKLVLILICVALGLLSTLLLSNKKLDECPHNENCCSDFSKEEED